VIVTCHKNKQKQTTISYGVGIVTVGRAWWLAFQQLWCCHSLWAYDGSSFGSGCCYSWCGL